VFSAGTRERKQKQDGDKREETRDKREGIREGGPTSSLVPAGTYMGVFSGNQMGNQENIPCRRVSRVIIVIQKVNIDGTRRTYPVGA
jgi:hypothetical protein